MESIGSLLGGIFLIILGVILAVVGGVTLASSPSEILALIVYMSVVLKMWIGGPRRRVWLAFWTIVFGIKIILHTRSIGHDVGEFASDVGADPVLVGFAYFGPVGLTAGGLLVLLGWLNYYSIEHRPDPTSERDAESEATAD